VLIDEFCVGNCEIFVQAMTHKPDALIVGMTATAGAVLVGGQATLLPANDFIVVVEYALRDPETGEPIIEGTGIEPTLRVPRTPETLIAWVTGDPVRDAAVEALLTQIDASDATPTS
jgi:C-terminal processing protease CtpA/Prc